MTTRIYTGNSLNILPTLSANSVQTVVTSPPYYGLRDYGCSGQIGQEQTPAEYLINLVNIFSEVYRVLKDDGTLWLNLGDSYSGYKGSKYNVNGPSASTQLDHTHSPQAATAGTPQTSSLAAKQLMAIPWRVAIALQDAGWYLRQDIIWHKKNPMPEPVTDRCTKAHEYIFLLSKQPRYYYDHEAIKEPAKYGSADPAARVSNNYSVGSGRNDGDNHRSNGFVYDDSNGRNRRSVWSIASKPYEGSHFAVMPPELARLCIMAGSQPGDTVLDPFGGAGTTALEADRLDRNAILIELNRNNSELAYGRLMADSPLFTKVEMI